MSRDKVHLTNKQVAVTYCRVSSKSQTTRGDGLGSQYTRCCEYAKAMGYTIVAEFHDDVTGKSVRRPGFDKLLAFIRKHKADKCIVLIDDISRLARDVEAHWELRRIIRKAGGELESPSIIFKEDADGRMLENMLAGAAQYQREKNSEQTYNRRRARLLNGYWVFAKPKGLRYIQAKGGGHILVKDEPIASIIKEGLEGFANARFDSQVELKRFFEAQPAFPKDLPNGKITHQRVIDMLKQPLYSGYLTAPKLDVSLRKAQHEGLISFATYEKIQQRLIDGAKAPIRKDTSEDFPLRGYVVCGDCENPLTACWSTSKTGKKHPYYLCFNKPCQSYRKSIQRDKIEGEFETLLQSMQPSANIFALTKAMFNHAWQQRLTQTKQMLSGVKQEISKIEKQIENVLNHIVGTDNTTAIGAYESKLTSLEKQKLLAVEKLNTNSNTRHNFEEMFELALRFLGSPYNCWVSGHIHLRKLVLRLAFKQRIAYHRNGGFSNPVKSLPFRMLEVFNGGENEMARPEGFEPPTP